MFNRRVHASFATLALVAVTATGGCSSEPTTSVSSTGEQHMIDLTRRYESGAISKEQ
jgi:hypothetical protein